MTPFAADQYIILALIFLLGLLVGAWLFAGTKWKRRYREEVELRKAAEQRATHGGAMDIAARARAKDRTAATTTTGTTTTTRP